MATSASPPSFLDILTLVKSARLYRFGLPLESPIVLKSGTLDRREGLILTLTDDEGNVGAGEMSPLPGFSAENLDAVLIEASILVNKVGADAGKSGIAERWESAGRFHPSLPYYGLETALISLLAARSKTHIGNILIGASREKIAINGLINGSLSNWVPEAQQAIHSGFKTLKIKVGRINHELEARGILEIREQVGQDIKLRLDANRSWDLNTALEFGRLVEPCQIEYIEEPLKLPIQLPRFFDGCGLHFAFDESLYRDVDSRTSFDSYTGLKALVMKPMLIASTSRLMVLANQARENGLLSVISSSYESDVGLTYLAQLASSLGNEDTAMGLDTGSVFSGHTLRDLLSIRDGWMYPPLLIKTDLDLSYCELIMASDQ